MRRALLVALVLGVSSPGFAAARVDKVQQLLLRGSAAEALFLLGEQAAREGRALDAHDLLRRYLDEVDKEAGGGDPAHIAEAQRVLKAPRPPSGEVSVIGERGALVRVDGRLVGSLPLSQPLLLAPGEHKIVVQGRRRQEGVVAVLPGSAADMRFHEASGAVLLTLPPAASPPPAPVAAVAERPVVPAEPAPAALRPEIVKAPPRRELRLQTLPRPRWRLIGGAAAVGAGVVLGGFGVSALVADGGCLDSLSADAECRRFIDTSPLGAGLLGAGVALVGAGVALMAVPGPRRRVEVLVLRPAGGVALGVAGAF